MASVCTNCGFNNPPGMRFCGNCGTRLVDGAHPHEVQQPAKPIEETQADPAQLGVMTGSDLLERFRQAGLEASGQRRSVTVLFVDLSGYTSLSEQLSDEALYEMVQKFIRILVNSVYKYEGMVDKLTGDGLMALFGAPIAHENNAERALRSALDMQVEVSRLSRELDLGGRELTLHVGVNSGSVIVGGLGSDAMMNYTAIGDSVNLARRLEEAAGPGVILVSESVYRQTYRLFDFEALPPLSLKNVSREVSAFRLIGPKDRPGSVRGLEGLRAPMIGREVEFSKAQERVDRLVQHRQGGVILLIGEGGMGKSRLTSELKARLDYSQVRVLEGHSLTYRKSIAYWIFQDMLRAYLGIKTEAAEEEVRPRLAETVHALLGAAAAEKLMYLEYLLALEPSDPQAAARLRYLDAGQLRQQIFLAVRDLLVAEARIKPLLLILEDLHWADEGSLELVRFLLDSTRVAPLLIYAISRPIEGGAVQAIHDRAQKRLGDRYVSIRLQALPPDQLNQLLEALLTLPDLPQALREQIIQRSAGLPFYLEEILRMLIEDNIIFRTTTEDGGVQWKLTPGADISSVGVPETLQGLILTRFDRLPPALRRVLQTASVIGYQFNAAVLRHVLSAGPDPLPEGEVQLLLDVLVEREFILPQADGLLSASGAGENYQFKHVLVSDAVYSTLLQRDRRELHTRVGQAVEAIYAGRLEGQIEVLASHFLRSSLQDRALHYLILAGQKAARSFANEQARQHFAQAQEILAKVDHSLAQAIDVHLGLGDSLMIAGEYLTAREQFLKGLEVLGAPRQTGALPPLDEVNGQARFAMPNAERVRLLSVLQRKVGWTHESQGDYEKALACLRAAEELLHNDVERYASERASILNDTGWIYSRRGNLDEGETILKEALSLAQSTQQIDIVASVLNRLAGIYFQRDLPEEAARYLLQSLSLREQIGDVVAVARCYNNLGLLGWKQGNLLVALENFNHSYKLQANLGDVEGLIVLRTNMGLIEMDRGNLEQSEQYFYEALEEAGQIGHFFHVCMAQMHLALLNVFKRNWKKVLDHAQLSLLGFQELGVQEYLVDLNFLLGCAYLGLDQQVQLEEVVQHLEMLLAKEEGPSEGEGRALRLFGQVASARQDVEQARAHLEKSAQVFQQVGSQIERSRSLVELARLVLQCGDRETARSLIAEARGVFKSMGAEMELHNLKEIEKSAAV